LPSGKRQWLYGRTRREVQDKLGAAKHDADRGVPPP
jgi:hypothetical protein